MTKRPVLLDSSGMQVAMSQKCLRESGIQGNAGSAPASHT